MIWHCRRRAFCAVQGLTERVCSSLRGNNPRPVGPRWIVTNVLVVTALELSDPVPFVVQMKPDDVARRRHGTPGLRRHGSNSSAELPLIDPPRFEWPSAVLRSRASGLCHCGVRIPSRGENPQRGGLGEPFRSVREIRDDCGRAVAHGRLMCGEQPAARLGELGARAVRLFDDCTQLL